MKPTHIVVALTLALLSQVATADNDWPCGFSVGRYMDAEESAYFAVLKDNRQIAPLLNEACHSLDAAGYGPDEIASFFSSLRRVSHSNDAMLPAISHSTESLLVGGGGSSAVVIVDVTCDACRRVVEILLAARERYHDTAPTVDFWLLPRDNAVAERAARLLENVREAAPDGFAAAVIEALFILPTDERRIVDLERDFSRDVPDLQKYASRACTRFASELRAMRRAGCRAPTVTVNGRQIMRDSHAPFGGVPFDPLADPLFFAIASAIASMERAK